MSSAANAPRKVDSLVIESDMPARNRLKQAAISIPEFGKMEFQSNTAEGLQRLTSGGMNYDVVFVSYRIASEEVVSFIKQGKEAKHAQDAAFILILENADQNSSVVASNMLVGADGLLFEPFSVDQLVEITRLAAKVKRERADAREKAALKVLVQDISTQIDLLSQLKKHGYDVGTTQKKLREVCAVLKTLDPNALNYYFETVVEHLENAPLPRPLAGKLAYGGVSSRVKKKMEARITSGSNKTV